MSNPVRQGDAPRGVILVCIAGVLWGTAPVAFDFIHKLTGLGAIQTSGYRLAIGAAALLIASFFVGGIGSLLEVFRRHPLAIALVGVGTASYQALWFAAITQIGASVATVICLGIAPILITVWESWRARRRPSVPKSLAVAAALVGLALVSVSASSAAVSSANPTVGLLFACGSGVLYSATTLISRRVAIEVSSISLSTASSLVGALCLLPLALLTGPVISSNPAAIPPLIYLGLITMAVASLLFYSGLRRAPASTAAVATLLEPVTAALLAVVVLAEPLSLKAALGIGLILLAVSAMSLATIRKPPRSAHH